MAKTVFVFSGQGAQYPSMGKELYENSPAAKAVFDMAETIRPGTIKQCFEGTKEELKEMTKIEEKITLEIDSLNEEIINEIREFKNVDDVTYDRNNLVVIYKKGKNNINELMDYLKSKKVNYNKIFVERPTLNDVFLELTGKDLRD